MSMAERDFKGVWIPKEIWLAKDIGWSAKMLLVEIDSLVTNGECFASNEYLGQFFSLGKDRISKLISELRDKGYIEVELVYKPGSKQIDKRRITTRGYRQKCLEGIGENTDTPIGEKADTPIGENTEDNNTVLNNTSLSNTRERGTYQRIADMYNEICISFPCIHSLSDARKKAIKARLNIYTEEDFKRLFEKAESSDFLKGKNQRSWIATFDWLIKDANMAKVLDGNYDTREVLEDGLSPRGPGENQRIGNYV